MKRKPSKSKLVKGLSRYAWELEHRANLLRDLGLFDEADGVAQCASRLGNIARTIERTDER